MDKDKISNRKVMILIAIILFIIWFCIFVIPSIAYTSDSYTGEYITANKVYMSDGGINLVIYFNESSGDTHFIIFEDWDARHSVLISNMENGKVIKVSYNDYIFGSRKIVDVEMVE